MSFPPYETLSGAHHFEAEPIQRSRFVCDLAPVDSPRAAEVWIAEVRSRHPDARHHCWAWRLGPRGEPYRSSDDGEPGGSAGRPILAQLAGKQVSDVCAVVSRWFGGIKLGVGGLARAYGGTTAKALDLAPRRLVIARREFTIEHPWPVSPAVEAVLRTFAAQELHSEFSSAVRRRVTVAAARADEFLSALRERTAGQAKALETIS